MNKYKKEDLFSCRIKLFHTQIQSKRVFPMNQLTTAFVDGLVKKQEITEQFRLYGE